MTDELPGTQFHAQVTQDGQVVVMTVDGELDISTVNDLAAYAQPVAASANDGLVVDLTGVRFLSSSAITELVRTRDSLPPTAVMALVAVNNRVVQPIRLSGIDRMMATFDDLPAAVAHVRGHTQAAPS
ncbi:STAS domain-containing protein [Rhodococcoides kyotonense]|nr:STAS domain-containing protein [Rhodococcus kyotonensis]